MRYTNAQYAQALSEALGEAKSKGRSVIVHRFLAMLQRHRAISRVSRILEQFEKHSLKSDGLVKVEVTSAAPLTDEIRQHISAALKKKVYLEEIVDAELLGGIKMIVNNEILIDASAKRHIEAMVRN